MNHNNTFFHFGCRIVLAWLAMVSQGVHAQDGADGPPPGWVGPPPGWSGGVLAGAARSPDYEGSSHARSQPVLGFEMTYRSHSLGSVAMGSRGLVWTVVQQPELSASLGLSIDPGRVDNGDRKLTPVGYRPGSDALRGLGEIDATALLSASGSYAVGGLALNAAFRRAATSYRGAALDLGVALPWKIGAHAKLTLSPSATWADRRYTQAFFGITPLQSSASGLPAFDTQAGLKSMQVTLDFDMALSRYWHAVAMLQAKRLQRDAANSPVTQQVRQTSGWLGLLYQFQL